VSGEADPSVSEREELTEQGEIGSSPDGGGCFERQGRLHRPITAADADTTATGLPGGDVRSHGPIIVMGSIVQLAYHESEQSQARRRGRCL